MGQAALERAEQQLARGAARRAAATRELDAARCEAAELARQLAEAEARAEHVHEAQAALEEWQRLQAASAGAWHETVDARPLLVFLPADEL